MANVSFLYVQTANIYVLYIYIYILISVVHSVEDPEYGL